MEYGSSGRGVCPIRGLPSEIPNQRHEYARLLLLLGVKDAPETDIDDVREFGKAQVAAGFLRAHDGSHRSKFTAVAFKLCLMFGSELYLNPSAHQPIRPDHDEIRPKDRMILGRIDCAVGRQMETTQEPMPELRHLQNREQRQVRTVLWLRDMLIHEQGGRRCGLWLQRDYL